MSAAKKRKSMDVEITQTTVVKMQITDDMVSAVVNDQGLKIQIGGINAIDNLKQPTVVGVGGKVKRVPKNQAAKQPRNAQKPQATGPKRGQTKAAKKVTDASKPNNLPGASLPATQDQGEQVAKPKRGRPKGSKNVVKSAPPDPKVEELVPQNPNDLKQPKRKKFQGKKTDAQKKEDGSTPLANPKKGSKKGPSKDLKVDDPVSLKEKGKKPPIKKTNVQKKHEGSLPEATPKQGGKKAPPKTEKGKGDREMMVVLPPQPDSLADLKSIQDHDYGDRFKNQPLPSTSHPFGMNAPLASNKVQSPQNTLQQPVQKDLCPVCFDEPLHPIKLPCTHIYCFLCAKGLCEASLDGIGGLCSLCRQPFSREILKRQRLSDVDASQNSSAFCWFYEAKSGGWWKFDQRNSEDIEEAFKSGVEKSQMLICGNLYIIDFKNMVQYKQNGTGIVRRIKRDTGLALSRGVAGLVSGDTN